MMNIFDHDALFEQIGLSTSSLHQDNQLASEQKPGANQYPQTQNSIFAAGLGG